ncbi:SLAP domain-containing protein [Lactobacillus sp. PSON]|uniref:SLAP domain-containing protein n=1 Tax=Lactobacillus sp. PSON TaxID=3455454 RepID=UPI00404340C3
MNKKVKITSLATAALATVVLASANLNDEVKADSQVSGTIAKANSAVDNAKANVDSAQKAVNDAQVKVNDAKSSLDSANSNAAGPDNAYSTQDGVVSKDRVDVKTKSDAVDNATKEQEKRQDLVNEAKKPNAIDNAKKAVSDKNDDIAKKQDAVKTAQSKTPAAEKAVNDAKSNLTDKQNVLNDKKTAKSDADKAVKNAQDALNGTGINEAKQAVDTYKSNIDNLNKSIPANEETLKHNQDVLKHNQEGLKKTQTDLNTAKTAQASAKSEFDKASSELQAAKNKLAQDQQIANSAAGFFKSLAEDKSLTDGQRKDAQMAYSVVMNEGKFQNTKLSWYNTKEQLGKENDATSLENMKAALNDFNELIAIRREYNLNLPKVSLTAVAIAMMSSDFEGKSEVADHPINLTTKYGPFFYTEEDIGYGTNYPQYSQVKGYMSELNNIENVIAQHPEYAKYRFPKNGMNYETYKQYSDFWLDPQKGGLIESGAADKQIGHLLSMLNPVQNSIGMAKYTGETGSGYDGASSTDLLNNELTDEEGTYKEISDKDYFNQHNKSDKKVYTQIGKTDVVKNSDGSITYTFHSFVSQYPSFTIDQYKDLVNNYNPNAASFVVANQNDVNAKQKVADEAKNNLDKANNNVSSLTESVNNFNTAITKTNEAITNTQNTINSQKTDLITQQKNLSDAQARLAALTASNEEKAKNLQTATANQAKAEEAVKTAQEAVNQAQSKLENAQSAQSDLNKDIAAKQEAVKNAQAELKTLEQHVSDLENAPANLDKANKELTTAKENLKTAQDTLTKDEAKLKDLQAAKDSADNAVATAQASYDQAQNELKTAQDKLTQAQNELKTIQDKEASKSNIKTPSTTKKSTKNETKSTAKQILSQKARVYDKNGKAIKKNGKFVTYKKGAKINGKLVTIKGKKYYQIGKNKFIKAGNVKVNKTIKKSAVKSIKLTHTAFVYDKNGKIVRKGFKINYIKRGKTVKALKTVTIKGKKYYQVGKNQFVKVSNAKLTTDAVHLTATIKAKKDSKVKTYARSGKLNKHYVLGKKSYKFNEKLTINGKTYYKIAGKNDWIPASKLNLKK